MSFYRLFTISDRRKAKLYYTVHVYMMSSALWKFPGIVCIYIYMYIFILISVINQFILLYISMAMIQYIKE